MFSSLKPKIQELVLMHNRGLPLPPPCTSRPLLRPSAEPQNALQVSIPDSFTFGLLSLLFHSPSLRAFSFPFEWFQLCVLIIVYINIYWKPISQILFYFLCSGLWQWMSPARSQDERGLDRRGVGREEGGWGWGSLHQIYCTAQCLQLTVQCCTVTNLWKGSISGSVLTTGKKGGEGAAGGKLCRKWMLHYLVCGDGFTNCIH